MIYRAAVSGTGRSGRNPDHRGDFVLEWLRE